MCVFGCSFKILFNNFLQLVFKINLFNYILVFESIIIVTNQDDVFKREREDTIGICVHIYIIFFSFNLTFFHECLFKAIRKIIFQAL